MTKYYTCDPNVIERGTHGCYFCNKSLYNYIKSNTGKYTILPITHKGLFGKSEVKIPNNLCIKVYLEYKKEYSIDKVTLRKVYGRDFVFDRKSQKLLGYKLYYDEQRKLYMVDESIKDALIEYNNIILLQKLFGDEFDKYILHPRENTLLYLITSHNSPELFETDYDNIELARNCVPILLSKSCNDKIVLTRKNVNKYITDIIKPLSILHSKGYIHSDMKLINSVRCSGGFKIIDWGSLIRADTREILETTYIMPFIAVWTLYQFKYINTIEPIFNWNELERLENLYGEKVIKAHFIGHNGWHFALLSYNMFYEYYKSREVDLSYLNKKNDEYGLALEVYLCLVETINPDELYELLKKGGGKNKTAKYLYYLMSPEYLGLKKSEYNNKR